MKPLMSLFSFLSFLCVVGTQPATAADGHYVRGADAAVELLTKEIARDTKIIAYKMNLARLRQTKEKLANDVPLKQKVIEELRHDEARHGNTAWLISLLQETVVAEEAIRDNATSQRLRRVAQRTITHNLERKKEALARLTK